ncbi:MAG: hypothetical protein K0S37_2329, partial [Microbacterium sp.]|nr:hypothetical protein [Microbacterium sp.]
MASGPSETKRQSASMISRISDAVSDGVLPT